MQQGHNHTNIINNQSYILSSLISETLNNLYNNNLKRYNFEIRIQCHGEILTNI